MFTGLIESVGRVASVTPTSSGSTIRIETTLAPELTAGESVAVNGVCLTVTTHDATGMHADIGPETALVTTLGGLTARRAVNLERSMRADSRFGGHFVQGHVDATATLVQSREDGDSRWLTIAYPETLRSLIVSKGSIAVDGISLTVAHLRDSELDLMIIPFTWAHTNLASLQVQDAVNIECDMIGKYVARAFDVFGSSRAAG